MSLQGALQELYNSARESPRGDGQRQSQRERLLLQVRLQGPSDLGTLEVLET